jgi:hypothetical protein
MITRRDCAKGLLLAAVPAGRQHALRNGNLELEISIRGGKVVSRRFHNRLARETMDLPAEQFVFEFDGGAVVASSALETKVVEETPAGIELLFTESGGPLEARVQYRLPPGKAYLRKQVWVRLRSGESRRLLRADLDTWKGVQRPWDSMHGDRLPYGSHPIFCDTVWAGVEFIAACNEYAADGFVLRSRPGGKPVGGEWLALHSTVAGVAEPKGVREAFLRYIDDVRVAPPRLVACYNSWWSLPLRFKQEEHLALIRELKRALFDQHGVFFDLVATDEGWTDPHTIWRIDRNSLPRGFDDVRRIVESAGGKLGLWISPSETYPRTLDYDWAEKNGYTVVRPRGVSLADPKYRNEAIENLTQIVRENRLGHIKYDGFIAAESVPHHGLLPGRDSVEPLAEHLLELLTATRRAAPGLFTEPTCLNSPANYLSPWIVQSADSIWAGGGTDCPSGLGPAPVHRESHTTAREYFIFAALNELWLPQNAIQSFDIIHCDDAPGFANHAAMAFGRGRFFISTYVNPKFMSGDDWRIYAGLLRWARANQAILRHTVVLPSRVELGEPYVYAHWLGSRGILVVRNPSNESKDFRIDLKKTGAPRELSGAVCYTQYPYRKGIATGLHGASTLPLRLAPWELVFLEVVPRAGLREPVAMDARWRRQPGGRMSMVPNRDAEQVRILEPGGRQRVVPTKPRAHAALSGQLISAAVRELSNAEWVAQEKKYLCYLEGISRCAPLPPMGQRLPGVAFDVACSVSIPPDATSGKLLLLVEFPQEQHRPSRCKAVVNGSEVPLTENHSAGHLWYRETASRPGIRPYLSQWTWYTCEVPRGTSRVDFTGAAGDPKCRIGLWAWRETDLGGSHVPVESQASEPAMPQYLPDVEREGLCLKAPS